MKFLVALIVLSALCSAVNATSPSDCLTLSPPFVLATSCARGYYCPNYNASNPDTYPAQCDPTTDCSLDRLSTKFCAAQGIYEPTLCPPGFYCPDPLTMLECPDGSSCLRGQYKPLECNPLSSCPTGTKDKFEYGSVIAAVISDIFLACIWFLSKKYQVSHARKRAEASRQLEVSVVNQSLLAKGATYQQLPEQLKVLCHGFKRAQHQLPPMRLEFKDLSLTIPSQNGLPAKTVLKGVTGTIEPAKVTAIMGPSGAGKTTFLNTMLGKVDDSWQRGGTLTINGRPENLSRFRSVIGYVPQEDIMQRELTVYDNIAYSANVRLPRDWSAKQREDHISSVIFAMQLGHVQDTRIGDELVRGVSGGQRKRCNIGMEVAAAPSLLLLDEPTSGLDSTSAMEICGVLKDLTRVSSLTVAMVIHQPRVEIWNQLDELLLLAPGGLTVYQGPQRLAVAYFKERLDVQLSPYENPADALMDRIADSADEFVQSWNQGGPAFVEGLKARELPNSSSSPAPAPIAEAALLPAVPSEDRPAEVRIAFNAPPGSQLELAPVELSSTVKTPANPLEANALPKPDLPAASDIRAFPSSSLRQRASFLTQIWLAFTRSLWKQLANSSNFLMENALSILAGFVIGALVTIRYQGILLPPYTLLSPSTLEGALPLAFFYVGLSISLAAASAGVGVFADEQAVYRRECASGHNLLAYYIGVSLAQLPRLYYSAIHFTLIFHLINQPLSGFGHWLIVAFLLYFSTYGLAGFMSMIASRKNSALLAVVICLIFSLMTGKSEIPEPIQYFSASRWASEAIFGVETDPYRHIMDVDRSAYDAGYELDRFGIDMLLMFVVGVFYRVITYAALRWAERKSVAK